MGEKIKQFVVCFVYMEFFLCVHRKMPGNLHFSAADMNPANIHEDVGSIPGLAVSCVV